MIARSRTDDSTLDIDDTRKESKIAPGRALASMDASMFSFVRLEERTGSPGGSIDPEGDTARELGNEDTFSFSDNAESTMGSAEAVDIADSMFGVEFLLSDGANDCASSPRDAWKF